jgi:heptaprenyl diphosphate synthase
MKERTLVLSRMALYISLGVALNVLEATLIPLGMVIPLPGARIGLANLVTLVVIMTESTGFAWAVMGGRVFLAGLVTGTLFSLPFALSLGGGTLALLVMKLLKPLVPKVFSVVGLSITGAVAHNCGQLLVLYLLMPGIGVVSLLPWLFILAIPSGWFNGYLAQKIISRLPGEDGY